MRHVIYLLVVMNLVYFSWNMLENMPHKGGSSLVRRIPPNVRRLETVEEQTADKASSGAADTRVSRADTPVAASHPAINKVRQEAAEISQVEAMTASEPPGADAPSLNCHVLGPFSDDSVMKTVENRLNQLGYKPRERTSDTRVESGYWIYLPSMERKEVLRITRMLEGNNDRDYLILKSNALSLGTYESRTRVDVRLKMLHKYGLEPVVEPRFATRTVYWLDLDIPDDDRTVLETIRSEYPEIHAQEAACA
jgi:hypothetical protein